MKLKGRMDGNFSLADAQLRTCPVDGHLPVGGASA